MKLEVYENEESGDVVRFRLRKEFGNIVLQVVNKSGDLIPRGNILDIRPDGLVELRRGIDPVFGLLLNSQGQVKTL